MVERVAVVLAGDDVEEGHVVRRALTREWLDGVERDAAVESHPQHAQAVRVTGAARLRAAAYTQTCSLQSVR